MTISLIHRIFQAQKILNASFGVDSKLQIDSESATKTYRDFFNDYQYLTESGLREVYQTDASRKDVSDQFLAISKSIKNMRSSFFPVEFFLSSTDEEQGVSSIADIQDNIGEREPYENTFLRMLGMPMLSWSDYIASGEIHRISPDATLLAINPITGKLERFPLDLIKLDVFGQRRYPQSNRTFVIDNKIYDVTAETTTEIIIPDVLSIESFTLKEKADLLSFTYQVNQDTNGVNDGRVTYKDSSGQVIDVTSKVSGLKKIYRGTPATGTPEGSVGGFINPIVPSREISPTAIARAPINESNPEIRTTNITNITKDLFKFCYLLVPPIQDPEVSTSINETDKLVAPIFSNGFGKNVNSNTVRTPLLESVIRIRLDKISGSSTFYQDPENPNVIGKATIKDAEGNDIDVNFTDDYGILESLFIVRLQSAISGLGSKMIYDIESLIVEMDKAKRYPASENEETGQPENRPLVNSNRYSVTLTRTSSGYDRVEEPEEGASEEDSIESDTAQTNQDINDELPPEPADSTDPDQVSEDDQEGSEDEQVSQATLVNLQNQKLIEDSLLFFLEDNKEILDLQFQTQRSSSIYDSHMVSGLLNIIDVPRKRIEEELSKVEEARDSAATNVIDELTGAVGAVFGTDIGIGTLDVAVFCLALFTISEDSLIGLLTPTQLERMKNGDFKTLMPRNRVGNDILTSLDELTELIYQGYSLFKQSLLNPDSDITEFNEEIGESEE